MSILCGCAHLGAVIGKWVHLYIESLKFASSVWFGTALIHMYAKCGILKSADRCLMKCTREILYIGML